MSRAIERTARGTGTGARRRGQTRFVQTFAGNPVPFPDAEPAAGLRRIAFRVATADLARDRRTSSLTFLAVKTFASLTRLTVASRSVPNRPTARSRLRDLTAAEHCAHCRWDARSLVHNFGTTAARAGQLDDAFRTENGDGPRRGLHGRGRFSDTEFAGAGHVACAVAVRIEARQCDAETDCHCRRGRLGTGGVLGAGQASGSIRYSAVRGALPDRRNHRHALHAASSRQCGSVRRFRHRTDSLRLPADTPVEACLQ